MITGDAVIKQMAAGSGIPFFIRLLKTGMEAQSHTGRKNPVMIPLIIAGIVFWGKILAIHFSDT